MGNGAFNVPVGAQEGLHDAPRAPKKRLKAVGVPKGVLDQPLAFKTGFIIARWRLQKDLWNAMGAQDVIHDGPWTFKIQNPLPEIF